MKRIMKIVLVLLLSISPIFTDSRNISASYETAIGNSLDDLIVDNEFKLELSKNLNVESSEILTEEMLDNFTKAEINSGDKIDLTGLNFFYNLEHLTLNLKHSDVVFEPIVNLPNLKTLRLYLTNESLSKQYKISMPDLINAPKLEELIYDHDTNVIPLWITSLENLRVLDLSLATDDFLIEAFELGNLETFNFYSENPIITLSNPVTNYSHSIRHDLKKTLNINVEYWGVNNVKKIENKMVWDSIPEDTPYTSFGYVGHYHGKVKDIDFNYSIVESFQVKNSSTLVWQYIQNESMIGMDNLAIEYGESIVPQSFELYINNKKADDLILETENYYETVATSYNVFETSELNFLEKRKVKDKYLDILTTKQLSYLEEFLFDIEDEVSLSKYNEILEDIFRVKFVFLINGELKEIYYDELKANLWFDYRNPATNESWIYAEIKNKVTQERLRDYTNKQPNLFDDVPVTNSFYDYINNLYFDKIIKGYSDGRFKPNNQLTRAQAAKMIVLAAEIDTTNANSHFKDVKKDSSSYEYISAAYEKGIISGYENETIYKPNEPVTRAQIAKMVSIAFDLEKQNNDDHFEDVDKLKPQTQEYIYTLSSLDIVKGYDDGFRPRNNVTRGQFAKIVSLARDVE